MVNFLFLVVFFLSSASIEDITTQIPSRTSEKDNPASFYDSQKQVFYLDTIAKGLDKPWGMIFLPGGDIVFTERNGSLHRIRKNADIIEKITGLPEIEAVGQGGLLDIALHPDFKSNSFIYFSYSKRVGQNYTTAVSRAIISGNSLTDVQELFEAKPAFSTTHHFGCRLVFKDGFLFFGVGDRGQMKQAQLLDRHNGKIIRLNDDGSVPLDNPFVSTENAKPEIWSYGHRNPQGLAVHPVSGDLWEHEHGPKGGDELNIIKKGANYGWPEITFGIDYDGTTISRDTHKEGMEQPVSYWVPSIAPCGMIFCNSTKYPNWKSNIFIGGLVSRALFRVELNLNIYVSEEKLLPGIGRVRNVALSPEGYIYISTESPGYIYRIVPISK